MTKTKLVPMPRNKDVQRFNVYLTEEFNNIKIRIEARRQKSGAFQYGNQTCVSIDFYEPDGRENRISLDTRYVHECSTPDGFEKWIGEYIKDYYGSNAKLIEQF